MRCPKCQYIGFDSGDRCRNCGYEFSLAVADDPPLEVTIGRDEPGARADLPLTTFDERLPAFEAVDAPAHPRDELPHLHDQVADPHDDVPPARGRHASVEGDLPLFTSRVVDDQAPLVRPPAVPRPPLSVRRAGPPRYRAPVDRPEPALDLAADPDLESHAGERPGAALAGAAAGVLPRATAGLIDVSLLAVIWTAVVYLTLRVAELPASDWRMLPLAPLGAFLLLLSGGYFTLFTAAGGQTIGKMVARIRVVAVSAEPERPGSVSFGTALLRAVICFCSVGAAGAGFLPVLLRGDRRAFHDRIADTRVVSA